MDMVEAVTELAESRSTLAILTLDPRTGELDVTSSYPTDNECLYTTDDGQQMYGTVTTDDAGDPIYGDDEVYVLLDKEGLYAQLQCGDTDDDGNPTPEALSGIAEWLSAEWETVLARVAAERATVVAEEATEVLAKATTDRAEAINRLVKACSGNQSQAARMLGLDQSTVNKILKRASLA